MNLFDQIIDTESALSSQNLYTTIDSYVDITSAEQQSSVLVFKDENGTVEININEIRRMKELLQEKYPEDYI